MTDRKSLKFNILYSVLQGTYWMNFCCAVSFAVVFFQARDFDNSELGVVLAVGNVLGFAAASLLSAAVDRYSRFRAGHAALILLAVETSAVLVILPEATPPVLVCVFWVMYLAGCMGLNSQLTKICIDAAHCGVKINYSVSRGIGSLAYVFASAGLGNLVESLGIRIIPLTGLVCLFIQIVLVTVIGTGSSAAVGADAPALSSESSTLTGFIRKYRSFSLLLPGIAALFISHNFICNFLLNITTNVGGGVAEMGSLNAFSAVLEIPVMFLYSRFSRKISCSRLVRISAVFFLIQAALIAAAGSIAGLYLGFSMQFAAFALYTPAIVDYTDRVIPFEDSAKAQSLAFGITTLAGVISSLLGGYLYDTTSVSITLWTGCGFALLGAAICLRAVENLRPKGAQTA